jgi:hypothetical protein
MMRMPPTRRWVAKAALLLKKTPLKHLLEGLDVLHVLRMVRM